jgi:DNA-binding CsgD family transcriptional regulator
MQWLILNLLRERTWVPVLHRACRIDTVLLSVLAKAIFRTAQDALEYTVRHARASEVAIHLRRDREHLVFGLSDDGRRPDSDVERGLAFARQWVERLGGAFEAIIGPQGNLQLSIRFVIQPPVELTPREMEVIQLLVEGLSNKEIAGLLYISPRTVNFHLDNVYSKLGVSSRTEAAIYALRHASMRVPG